MSSDSRGTVSAPLASHHSRNLSERAAVPAVEMALSSSAPRASQQPRLLPSMEAKFQVRADYVDKTLS